MLLLLLLLQSGKEAKPRGEECSCDEAIELDASLAGTRILKRIVRISWVSADPANVFLSLIISRSFLRIHVGESARPEDSSSY